MSRRDSPSDEFLEFDRGLAAAIRFIYAGMDSESWFRSILRNGGRNAEGVDLENIEDPFLVNVDFEVESAEARSPTETAEHIKNNHWDKITAADVSVFLRYAKSLSTAFDIDEIIEGIEETRDRIESGGSRANDDDE